ncbi:MAG: MerR family transcriptional regulator [Clostridia bacterium]|nr:MerR family transcriptional regulator [Clostridia bacterium]
MEIMKDRYTITELSERLQITDHALRYYEKEFNLKIPKDDRGRRFYTTEMANLMYQIKKMRDDGLEIKAIKKILEAENIINEPPPVVLDDGSMTLMTVEQCNPTSDFKQFFEEFKEQLANKFTVEVSTTREIITKEINKTKLELGACVENSVRKLENKMEKHFAEVDRSLSNWREKSKKSIFKKLINKIGIKK